MCISCIHEYAIWSSNQQPKDMQTNQTTYRGIIDHLSWPSSLVYARTNEYKKQNSKEEELFKALMKQSQEAYKREDFQLAINLIKKALLFKKDSMLHRNLSAAYKKLKQYDKAIHHMDQYMKMTKLSTRERKKMLAKRQEMLIAMQEQLNPSFNTNPTQQPSPRNQANTNNNNNNSSSNQNQQPIQSSTQMKPSPQASSRSGNHSWLIWGIVGLSSSVLSLGLHLYADSTWQNRPTGGGTQVEELQQTAYTTSWIGDGFLLVGVVSLGISVYQYIKMRSHIPMSQQSFYHNSLPLPVDPLVLTHNQQTKETMRIPSALSLQSPLLTWTHSF